MIDPISINCSLNIPLGVTAPVGTALATVGAAIIGAGLAAAQLINAKENKTSEFRQEWTLSLRTAISDYCGQARTIAGRISTAKKHGANLNPEQTLPKNEGGSSANITPLQKLEEELKPNWEQFARAYYAVELHFKPHDATEKSSKERALRAAMAELNQKMKRHYNEFTTKDIETSLDKVLDAAAPVLKQEWENIKAGEPTYQTTKWILIGLVSIASMVGAISFLVSSTSSQLGEAAKHVECKINSNADK